jgi:Tfp pilus assembly protein PilF
VDQQGASPSWLSTPLKWIAALTAVISLVLGVRQLATWLRDTASHRREAAALLDVGKQQASRGEFADAWKSFERAEALRPDDALEAARVEVAYRWLEDARPGPNQPFSTITQAVTPVLDRRLVQAKGAERADLLAHLGWAEFLRFRDGDGDGPEKRYQEALAADADNVYANTFLGHWLMWNGAHVDAARARFERALAHAGSQRGIIRRFELASLKSHGDAADAEFLRVVGEMRNNAEPLTPDVAADAYWLFTLKYGRPGDARGVRKEPHEDPAAELATYEWVVATPESAERNPDMREYVHGVLQEAAGRTQAARDTFTGLQQRRAQLSPPIQSAVGTALVRLGKPR